MRAISLAVWLTLFSLQVSAIKFLVYSPLRGRSSVTFMGKLAEVLVDAGHEVVMLAPIIDTSITSVGTNKIQTVIKVPPCQASKLFSRIGQDSIASQFWTSKSIFSTLRRVNTYLDAWVDQCNATLHHPGLLDYLKEEKFDAAITDSIDLCGYGIFRHVGIEKFAAAYSAAAYEGSFDFTGLPSFPSYVPGSMMGFSEKMTFVQRAVNTISLVIGKYFIPYHTRASEGVLRAKFGSDFPGFDGLLRATSLWFFNAEPLIEFPRPKSDKVIDIGGISMSTDSEPLSQDWSEIMDLRSKTVLLSFGSVVKSSLMPEKFKGNLRKVFKRFPEVTFIWKYEEPSHNISFGIPNLIEASWIPQRDLLNDGRLSLFLTHGGQGSTTEATTAGVPLILVPLNGDQKRNAAVVNRAGTGIVLDKESFENVDRLERAFIEALGNTKYREKAREVGEMIRSRPFSPRETFVRNMEFLARFGPLRMLDHYGRELNFIQFYLIDVFAFFIASFLLSLFAIYKSLTILCCFSIRKAKVD